MPNRYSIVAMNHCKSEDFVKNLQPGVLVTLVREPTNKFDANAVMVWADGKHVGYIPKATNKQLAQFIDTSGQAVILNGTPLEAAKAIMGMDNDLQETKSITGKFVRSPNSGYPQVEV